MTESILSVRDLTKSYYGVTAVDNVTFDLPSGEITGLIGPNGSGKSTLFDCLSGISEADGGTVSLYGAQILGEKPEAIAQRKLIRTFQNITIFPDLSLIDNMRVVAQAHSGFGFLREIAGGSAVRKHEAQATLLANHLLEEIELFELRHRKAGEMSYGQQKLLVMGMAMMAHPRLVLFDEPVAGVNPTLIEKMKRHILRWHSAGVDFFIVEHNLRLIMDLCSTVLMLDQGRILTEGSPEAVVNDPRVIEAYLGGEPV
ncbi:ABC transporter ATP-binding protein [bacterium]|nr:ABC transporter ATP-binding protein [bacterium]